MVKKEISSISLKKYIRINKITPVRFELWFIVMAICQNAEALFNFFNFSTFQHPALILHYRMGIIEAQ